MLKRGKYPVKTIPANQYSNYQLGQYPNFHKNGSILGMKNFVYGLDAKLVKCGNYIYNVSSNPDIYDNL